VSIDDRIRTATEATAATVREIRPLTLPDELAPARQRRLRSQQTRRGWGGWLVPLAAAVAVIVVAAILVAVRDLPGVGHASAPTPAGHGGGVAGLPRYGVMLTKTTAKIPPQWGSGDVEVSDLSVIDTRTGKQVALVKHPANFGFTAVSGAADDRTFAVSAVSYALQPLPGTNRTEDIRVWYLLRIAPGSSQPVQLTRLPIPVQPGEAVINGLALSPDGRTLAVLDWCTVPGACYRGAPGTLQLYSVATGKALRVWTWGTLPDPVPSYGDSYGFSQNSAGLTWLADGRTLAFTYYAHGQAPAVRTLDTTRPGNDLVADSRRAFTLPSSGSDACSEAQLTRDGQTVVCGTQVSTNSGCDSVTKETLEIDAYSAATGKRERILYRYTGHCTQDGIGALGWVGPGNTVVAMVDAGILKDFPYDNTAVSVGVVTQGKLVPLLPAALPFDQGPGAIAF
jgi:hypothetical protein